VERVGGTFAARSGDFSSARNRKGITSGRTSFESGVHLRCANKMKHKDLRWNPSIREWFCTSCGRTTNVEDENQARASLDQYECTIPSVEVSGSVPGTETKRLIRKPYKMTLKRERSGSRFVAARTEDGGPSIRLELFHDSVPSLKSLTIGFEVLGGTTPAQLKALLDAMNERIVGTIVTPTENHAS
jgi:hypothetical protein